MMMALLVFKSRCKEIYEKHYKILRSMLKIIISAIVFSMIILLLPFHEGLSEYAVPLVIVLSVFCGFIPDMAIICLVILVTLLEVLSVSLVSAFAFSVVLIIYFLLFGRYASQQSYLIVLIPILWHLDLQYAVPLVAALFLTPAMIPSCAVGVLIQFLLDGTKEYYTISQNSVDTGNTMESMQYITDYVIKSKEMLLYMILFVIVYLLVYVIRKGKYNHASYIAIFVGLITYMGGAIFGDIFWAISLNMKELLLGLAGTAVIAYIIQFFRMSLDYTGVRKLQFEDDEYFYYVKAVPKLKAAPVDKTVTRIEEDLGETVIDLKEEIEKVLDEDINPDIK